MIEEEQKTREKTEAVRIPEISEETTRQLGVRRRQKAKKPEFKRQGSWRYKRVKPSWRRPKGIDSKMRLKLRGRPKSVEVGYRSPRSIRGLNSSGHAEALVFNVGDLDRVRSDQVVRIGHVVGRRKRLAILDRAKELELFVVNTGRVGS